MNTYLWGCDVPLVKLVINYLHMNEASADSAGGVSCPPHKIIRENGLFMDP